MVLAHVMALHSVMVLFYVMMLTRVMTLAHVMVLHSVMVLSHVMMLTHVMTLAHQSSVWVRQLERPKCVKEEELSTSIR